MKTSVPPIISVVGKSGCGKTTLIEALIPILMGRGYHIATVKHHSHAGVDIDQPGKDTWRHFQAGADVVVIASPDRMSIMERLESEPPLEEIACQIATTSSVDLILTEGYRRGPAIKIEVVRAARSAEVLCAPDELLVLVTDLPTHQLPGGVSICRLDDVQEVADRVECFLIRQRTLRAAPGKRLLPAEVQSSEAA